MVSGTQLVMLKVRFAQMQWSACKSLSSSLGLRDDTNAGRIGATGVIAGQSPASFKDRAFALKPGTQGAMGLCFTRGSLVLGALLEALASKGVVRTLAEPNLKVL